MEDDDEGEVEIPSVRLHPALLVSSGFSLLADLAHAVADFWDTNALMLAAHFNWTRDRLQMQDEATREIETLTQGD